MSDRSEFASGPPGPAESLVSLLRDSLAGYTGLTNDLLSRTADPAVEVDPLAEMSRWCRRMVGDGARLLLLLEGIAEGLASETPFPKVPVPDGPPATNLVRARVGPVSQSGRVSPADLRRRGETVATIPANLVTVNRNAGDPSQLDIEVQAGGFERGLYEGSLTVGGAAAATATLSYNVYVDY